MTIRDEPNARIPTQHEVIGDGVFYVINTLVLEVDGNRVLGPYNSSELAGKRDQYESIMKDASETDRLKHPFVALRLSLHNE